MAVLFFFIHPKMTEVRKCRLLKCVNNNSCCDMFCRAGRVERRGVRISQ
jgi:hypothetical protein